MKKLTWYHEMGFYTNPFSIKPASFDYEIQGQEKIVEEINEKIRNSKIVYISGEYGTGKTTFLKKIINEFKGRKKVIYYNCHEKENEIDFDRMLIRAGGFLRRIFRIRKKGMIILLDEMQDINKKDFKKIKTYHDEGFFRSVVLVSNNDDVKLSKEIDWIAGDNKFKINGLSKTEAVELIRQRIGDLKYINDTKIEKIFEYNKNPRIFLKNCEEICRYAYENGSKIVTNEHIKNVLEKKKK